MVGDERWLGSGIPCGRCCCCCDCGGGGGRGFLGMAPIKLSGLGLLGLPPLLLLLLQDSLPLLLPP